MTSIVTNTSARVALQTLRSISSQIDNRTQRLSTGQRISTAADGAAYWAIATTLRSDRSTSEAIKSGLALALSGIDAASAGLSAAVTDLGAIRERLVSAMSENVDRNKLQREIVTLQEKLRNNAAASGKNGQNWLSVDSRPGNPNWQRFASFALGAPRGSNGILSLNSERLDIASIALFDENTVVTYTPSVVGSVIIDQIDRLADSINQSNLRTQVYARRVGTDTNGNGILRLEANDVSKTIRGTYSNSGAPPVDGNPIDHPVNQFGEPLLSYVDIPVASLSAGDVVAFQVPGSPPSTFTVTNEGDGLDFSGNNEVRLNIVPFKGKYPDVAYDIVVNGSTLLSRGYADLSSVSRWNVVEEITYHINEQHTMKYQGVGSDEEILVKSYNSRTLVFDVNASGPFSSIEVTVAAPTIGNSLIDIGYGMVPGSVTVGLGFQEPARTPKGILDTSTPVASRWRTNLDGARIPVDYSYVSIAEQSTAFRIDNDTTQEQIQALSNFVDETSTKVLAAATKMAGLKTLMMEQSIFLTTLADIQQSAIGTLVDADIEEEATMLRALQTQQQLGMQSLSIANASAQNVTSLFS